MFVAEATAFSPIIAQLADYDCVEIAATGGYMNALIARRAAMVFVDARASQWRNFVIAPKASAATRRIPIVVASDESPTRADAIYAGADLAMPWPQLTRECRALVADYGRALDSETTRRLACECQDTLPPLAEEGIRQFNRGAYYRQHDLFEEQWAQTTGPVRDLYRAILQVGIAMYQIEKGNYRGALKMLQRSVQWLHILPDSCQGVDVAALRRDSYALRAELERLGPGRLAGLDRSLLKPIRWVPPDN